MFVFGNPLDNLFLHQPFCIQGCQIGIENPTLAMNHEFFYCVMKSRMWFHTRYLCIHNFIKKSLGIYDFFFSIKMPRRCMCGSPCFQILVINTHVFKQPKTCLYVVIHEWFHFQLKHTNHQVWVINYMLTSTNSSMISY